MSISGRSECAAFSNLFGVKKHACLLKEAPLYLTQNNKQFLHPLLMQTVLLSKAWS